jgi:hypothetical protein
MNWNLLLYACYSWHSVILATLELNEMFLYGRRVEQCYYSSEALLS